MTDGSGISVIALDELASPRSERIDSALMLIEPWRRRGRVSDNWYTAAQQLREISQKVMILEAVGYSGDNVRADLEAALDRGIAALEREAAAARDQMLERWPREARMPKRRGPTPGSRRRREDEHPAPAGADQEQGTPPNP